ncbi:Dehydrogenase [Penicillium canariense]|uniref:Dehydrogenase n=1 Tax=Penicillium canariense TaxID=189055 RepID=A0A9W9I7D3_9EURO|nr:Dehydrogenase [Penicillium canariense]KAJ5166337.1 Dehydrogenase [Penicillium canariense]
MSSQKALTLTEIGKPLTQASLPCPDSSQLKDHEILVKITAAGSVISGDIVGTVIENGAKSTFPVGSRVFSQMLFSLPRGGGLQEYTTLNGEYAAIVPETVPDTEAALYPINLVTAALSLFSAAGFDLPLPETPEAADFDYASQKIVIIGGGSNIGKLSVQLAKLAGIGTIITIASSSNEDLLKSFGATHVIARQDANIDLGASLLSNSKKGIFAHNGTGQIPDLVIQKKKYGLEDKRVLGFSHFIPEFGQTLWRKFPDWLEQGKIKPLAYRTIDGLDAEKVNEALDEYAAGRSAQRYHVRIV